jgi:hypothetical protein
MAHACNPSYLEGRDQENRGSKPAQANSCKTLSQKTHHKNRIGGVAQGEGPTFKPQYHKKKVVGKNRGDRRGSINSWDKENFPDITSLGI